MGPFCHGLLGQPSEVKKAFLNARAHCGQLAGGRGIHPLRHSFSPRPKVIARDLFQVTEIVTTSNASASRCGATATTKSENTKVSAHAHTKRKPKCLRVASRRVPRRRRRRDRYAHTTRQAHVRCPWRMRRNNGGGHGGSRVADVVGLIVVDVVAAAPRRTRVKRIRGGGTRGAAGEATH